MKCSPAVSFDCSDGSKIQVKYLANPPEAWINEHHIVVNDEMDKYAVVFFEALLPVALRERARWLFRSVCWRAQARRFYARGGDCERVAI